VELLAHPIHRAQLDGAARQELLALEVLRGVESAEESTTTSVAALHNTVWAMRLQVRAVSGALEELHRLRDECTTLRAMLADQAAAMAGLADALAPVREWHDVFGADAMAQIKALRGLDGRTVDSAGLVDVGLAASATVPDSAFTAYGNVHASYHPHMARINNGNNGCLITNARAGVDWVQVVLPAFMVIGGLSWQGANSGNAVHQCWKTVSLRVSLDGAVWRDVDGGATFTRPAGTTDNTAYSVTLATGHLCRFVRLVFHAHGAAGAGGNEYVRWELKHIPAPAPAAA